MVRFLVIGNSSFTGFLSFHPQDYTLLLSEAGTDGNIPPATLLLPGKQLVHMIEVSLHFMNCVRDFEFIVRHTQ